MRLGLLATVSFAAVGALLACSSGSNNSPATGDAGASVCADTSGLVDLFNTTALACPLNSAMTEPVSYDTAIDTSCSSLGMKSGDIQFGQCDQYLVWELDLDMTGRNFSKCFYDVKSHVLVGAVYSDGNMDQCGGSSYTIEAGTVETCSISGLSAPGAGGMFEDCAPKPDAGPG
jgi:hypothetical protein